MPTPTIINGKNYMNTITYTGTAPSDNAVTGVGFAPDVTWLKRLTTGVNADWGAYDTSRGATKAIKWNKTDAESTESNGLKVFGTDGFTVGSSGDANASGASFAAFNWLVNGGTTESISASGTIDIASTVQKNTTAGFSIVQWTGDNATTAGIGHGLTQAPEFIIIRNLSSSSLDIFTYHHKLTPDQSLKFNSDATPSAFARGHYDHSEIDATKFEVKRGSTDAKAVNGSSDNMVAYCWHGVEGFSKFGSYTGNGSSAGDGTFVYLGFTAQFIIIKNISATTDWTIWDGTREPLNPTNNSIFTNLAQGENGSSIDIDVLSNGFKCRTTNSNINASSNYVYMAFASNPFVGDGTSPVTAR